MQKVFIYPVGIWQVFSIDIEQQKDICVIRQCNGDFKVEIKAEFLVFQSCSVYLS